MKSKMSFKKFIFSLVLAVGLVLGIAAVCSFADTYTDNQGVIYEYSNQIASVVGNTNVSGDITIPSTITINGEDYDVTTIGKSAFENCTSLTKITIPNSVTSIGNYTFKGCSNLTSVTFEDTQENPFEHLTIGTEAFHSCTSLKSITLPSGFKPIFEDNAFSESLEDIYLPANASLEPEYLPTTTRIWRYSIVNTETINGRKTVNINSEETENEKPASLNCTAMGDGYSIWHIYVNGVTLQHASTEITEIDGVQVEFCTECGLQILTSEPATVHNWVEITSDWEKIDKVQNGNNYTIWTRTSTKACTLCEVMEVGSDIFVPEGYDYSNDDIPETTCIWTYSVIDGKAIIKSPTDHRDQFVNVIIPSKIGDYPVTTIDELAFGGCGNLQNITIPNSVTTIGVGAFYSCSSLTSITIPSSVTTIGERTFQGCMGLTSITIPSSVTTIGDFAFAECIDLTSITIPNSVTTIGEGAFQGCMGLTSITIPSSVTTIGEYAFSDCSSLGNIEIPSSVTTIGDYAFEGCSRLTSVNISEGVTTIGESAFENCSSLTSITIPSSVTSIGDNAFNRCSRLTDVFAPRGGIDLSSAVNNSNVNIWRYEVLDSQEGAPESKTLIQITSRDQGPDTSLEVSDTFLACNAMGDNYVIRTVPSGFTLTHNCGASYISDSIFEIEINEIMWTCTILQENGQNTNKVSIAPKDKNAISGEITIPSVITGCVIYTVTEIGKDALSRCRNLTSVVISNGIESIGQTAFAMCTDLETIEIPESIKIIGYLAFNSCSSLKSVNIPSKVESIDDSFHACNKLEAINVDENNNYYSSENGVLYDKEKKILIRCPQTKTGEFVIPESVTSIGKSAFSFCQSLTSVTIPESVTSIGNSAFSVCQSLTSVTIPESVTSIGNNAFGTCTNLKKVIILSENVAIGFNAFYNSNNLEDIYIQEGIIFGDVGVSENTRIWRYTAGEDTINSRMIVNIVSETGGTKPASLDCTAMGDSCAIKSIDESLGVTLNHVGSVEVTQEAKEATCIEIGYNAGTEVCETCGLPTNSSKIIPATGHNYGAPTYSWTVNKNTATCTATRICTNDASHVENLGTATVAGYTGTYNGKNHGLEVVNDITNTTLMYKEGSEGAWVTGVPTRNEIGTTTVYVKIQDNNDNTINLEADDPVMIKIIRPGDINGDGFVNIIDLQMLYNHLAGIKMLTNVQMMPANLNNGTEINVSDSQALFNIITSS